MCKQMEIKLETQREAQRDRERKSAHLFGIIPKEESDLNSLC